MGFSPPIFVAAVALCAFAQGATAEGHFPGCVMQLRGLVSSADHAVSYPNGALLINWPKVAETNTRIGALDWENTSSNFAKEFDAFEALAMDKATPLSVARCDFSTIERFCVFTYFAVTTDVQGQANEQNKGPSVYMFPTLSENCIAPPS